MTTKTVKPQWVCPICGQRFSRANTQHSCGRYSLEEHFAGKQPIVRELFDHYLAVVHDLGPVTVIPLKSRIVFQARERFAGAVTRQRWLEGFFWLRRRAHHPLIHRFEMHVFRDYGHYFRLARPEDLDEDLTALLHEAHALAS